MKKSIFVLLASICIALFFAMNVSINLSKDQSKSGLALKNIEALARGETPGGDNQSLKAHMVVRLERGLLLTKYMMMLVVNVPNGPIITLHQKCVLAVIIKSEGSFPLF